MSVREFEVTVGVRELGVTVGVIEFDVTVGVCVIMKQWVSDSLM